MSGPSLIVLLYLDTSRMIHISESGLLMFYFFNNSVLILILSSI